jgi:enterochelin esterase-like enzyme
MPSSRLYLIVLAVLTVLMPAGCHRQQEPTVSVGRLDSYVGFPSRYVSSRTVRVWLPSTYDPSLRYDVLYMHDGQMLWDASVAWNHQEWGVDEAMDSLIATGRIRPTIVVGIDNTGERIGEFCPDDIAGYLPEGHPVYEQWAPQGNAYLRFLVEEVKPFIDSVYPVYTDHEHTWVMGSSCGGLISSYALCQYPHVFAGAACLSTHCTLAYPHPDSPDSAVMAAYRLYLQEHMPANSCLLYMDDGDQTLDAFYGDAQEAINTMLRDNGWDEKHFLYRFFPGHAHCEDDWRARLDIPVTFLLAKEKE